jgi:hypothetical protein
VHCVPKGANKLGEVSRQGCHLEIEASLFPGFVRTFRLGQLVKKESNSRSRQQKTLDFQHSIGANHANGVCTWPNNGLNPQTGANDGIFSFHPDVSPSSVLQFRSFDNCKNCSIAPIWLLHAFSSRPSLSVDFFIVLKEIDLAHKKFERIGVSFFTGHTGNEREQWFRTVWNKDIAQSCVIVIQ